MKLVKSTIGKNEKLQSIVKLLENDVPYYDWVGIYIANASAKELCLGPFTGEPTVHTKIHFGEGICGKAADRNETIIVQDVSKETNYLSCSPFVKSEIVVPIRNNSRIVGELDIDSNTLSAFTEEDQRFLEDVCNIVSQLF